MTFIILPFFTRSQFCLNFWKAFGHLIFWYRKLIFSWLLKETNTYNTRWKFQLSQSLAHILNFRLSVPKFSMKRNEPKTFSLTFENHGTLLRTHVNAVFYWLLLFYIELGAKYCDKKTCEKHPPYLLSMKLWVKFRI